MTTELQASTSACDTGEHAESRQGYADLLTRLPDHAVIRRNALTSLEYDPGVTDAERLTQAKAWGDWAIARAGGWHNRPALPSIADRPCASAMSPPTSANTPWVSSSRTC